MKRNKKCLGCIYTIPKERGGQGVVCDGHMARKHGSCTQWYVRELQKDGRLPKYRKEV